MAEPADDAKHQCEDGSYPEVRLLKAERRECVKALALSSTPTCGITAT
ncbi:MAG: hypothetical protein KAX55_04995 [Propionivibrio sp.]|nr:hypothetical protein [Propionivibrio sp.]